MQRISFWLMPSRADARKLARIILELAARFDAPVFTPHVTLYAGTLESFEQAGRILKTIGDKFSGLTLNTTGIAHSGVFTKTLFI